MKIKHTKGDINKGYVGTLSPLSLYIKHTLPVLLGTALLSGPAKAADAPVTYTGDNQAILINNDIANSSGSAVSLTGNNNTITYTPDTPDMMIFGKNGVSITGQNNTFTNNGQITATGTKLAGSDAAILASGSATINNSASGVITSESDAIYGSNSLTVNNDGKIISHKVNGSIVYYKQGGSYYGSAGSVLEGASYGLYMMGGNTRSVVDNAGSITTDAVSIYFGNDTTGTLTNQQGSVIASKTQAIKIDSTTGVNILNQGTISSESGTAIDLTNGSNAVTLGTGSVIEGDVVSSTADTNTLTLIGSGSEDANFVGDKNSTQNGFKSLTMQGDDWMLSGNVNLTGSDATTLNVESGRLTLAGNVTAKGNTQVASGATLLVDGSGTLTTPQLNIATNAQAAVAGTLTGDVNNAGTFAAYNAIVDGPASAASVNGNLTNSGTLQLGGSEIGNILTISGNYTGDNGTVVINSALAGDNAPTDALVIEGDSRGSSSLVVNNIGGLGAQTVQGMEVISVGGDSSGQFTLTGRAVSGAYEYNLFQSSGNGGWYLSSQAEPEPQPTPDPDPQPEPTPEPQPEPTPEPQPELQPVPDAPTLYRPEVGAYLGNQLAAQQMFISQMSDRYAPAGSQESGLGWARIKSNASESQAGNGGLSVDTTTTLLQVGGDLFTSSDARWHAGLMAGIGDSENDAHAKGNRYNAKGDVTGYSVGAYATWFQDAARQQGLYADSWVQYNKFDNHVTGADLASESYHSQGVQASLETGYTLPFGRGETREWAVTPQAQLIYSHLESDDHTEANGTRVSSGADDALFSHLGARLTNRNVLDSQAVQFYGEANWKNGADVGGMAFDGEWVNQDMPENRYQAVIGLSGSANSHVQLWGQVGGEWGEHHYSDYQGSVGVRVNW